MADKVTRITMLVDASQGKTEVRSLNAEMSGQDKALASSALAVKSSSASIGELLQAKNRLAVQSSVVSNSIKAENASITALQAAYKGGSITSAEYAAASQIAERRLAELLLTQRTLAVDTGGVNTSIKALTPNVETATNAWMRHTNMINTGQGPLRGYDALVQAVARSMGGIPVIAAVAIPVIAALAQAFFKAGEAKRENIKLDEEGLKIDLASVHSIQGKQRQTLDLMAVLIQYRSSSKALQESLQKETEGFYDVINAQERAIKVQQGVDFNSARHIAMLNLIEKIMGTAAEKQEKLTDTRLKDQVRLNETTQALIKFAAANDLGAAAVVNMAKQVGFSADELAKLQKELDGGALALQRFQKAMDAAKEPHVDFSKTRDAVLGLQESVKGGFSEATQAGITRFDDKVRANHKSLSDLSSALKNNTIVMADLDAETQKAVKRHDELETKHRSGAGAARSYANALVDLKARAQEAELALRGDSFVIREERIGIAMQKERDHLEINRRDKRAAVEALDRIERAQIEKLSQDRVEAEQRVMVDIARINIAAIKDETERRKTEMALDIALREQAIRREFGDTVQAADLMKAYRQAKVQEFQHWEKEENAKHWLEQRRTREDAERELLERLKKEHEKFMIEQRRSREQMERQHFDRFGGFEQRGAPIGQSVNMAQLREVEEITRRLGITQDRYDHALQVTNRDLNNFLRLMARTAQFTRGSWFGGLINSIKDVGKAFVEGGALGVAWSDAIVGAIEITLQSGGNFAATFGKLLLGGILSAFGQMAITQGTFHILSGIALMANPWTFAQGAREFAGGTALVAFGALLGAAGGMISASARSSAAGSNATQSSAAGAPAQGTPTSSRAQAQGGPVLVNVPTSARRDDVAERLSETQRDLALQRANREALNQRASMGLNGGPVTFQISLGTEAGEKFIDGLMQGRGVLTVNNALGTHRARLIKGLKG